jgi:uracil-DNA glycosylase
LSEIIDAMETAPRDERKIYLQKGSENRVAVVFSCPGRHEEMAGRPAAKATGKNLELLLSILGEALGRDLSREKVTITNAWPEVEYRGKTGRTEASPKEITAAENVARLQQELQDITDFVIFCGERARLVAGKLRLKHHPKLVFIRHPGLRGLSTINTDIYGGRIVAAGRNMREAQAQNNKRRLEFLVQQILCQLEER